jgi:protein tyrosine phosphatase (PTP) superfamily phosphohydrolase (DUF442 family)
MTAGSATVARRGVRLAMLALACVAVSLGTRAAAPVPSGPLRAPNVVEISPQLVTAGQPSAEALAELRARGFGAVVYLVPPTAHDAVRDESTIVGRQGLVFVNLPIPFNEPTARDVETFFTILRGLQDRKVLVHCQVNMRASTLVFLYRAIALREDPRVAWDAVARVWSPNGPWKNLVQEQLLVHKIDFDPF